MRTIEIFVEHLSYLSRIQYVIDFLNHHPLKPKAAPTIVINHQDPSSLSISYGTTSGCDYDIPCQQLIFSDQIISNDQLSCHEYWHEDLSVYAVESIDKKKGDLFLSEGGFGFDIIETIFFHISRYEEYHCSDQSKDQWDMMWEKDQLLVIQNLHRIPIVDHIIVAFYRALGFDVNRQVTTYSMSHDIDVIEKYRGLVRTMRSFGRAFLDNGIRGLYNNLSFYKSTKFNSTKDPFSKFSYLLIDQSSKVFTEKVLYLMTGGETKHDNYYQVNDQNVSDCIDLAVERGYQIGLHGSYNSSFKVSLFADEKDRLEEAAGIKVIRSRQHFLRFSFKKTPEILDNSGIEIDSTLGYQRLIGFRCGTGFPYQLYSFVEERAYQFEERPMIVMDGALLNECGGDLDKAKALLMEFQYQNRWWTHVNYNVHNTIFDPVKRDIDKMKDIYSLMTKPLESS